MLGAWLEYAAGYSVVDLSLAECDEVYGEMRFEAERLGPLAGFGARRRARPGAGTWWLRGEVMDRVVNLVVSREASRARRLVPAA